MRLHSPLFTIGFSIIHFICLVCGPSPRSVCLLCRQLLNYLLSPSQGSLRGVKPWISPNWSVPSRTPDIWRGREQLGKEPTRGISQPPAIPETGLPLWRICLEAHSQDVRLPGIYSHVSTKTPSETSPDGFLLHGSASACANHRTMTIIWILPDLITLFTRWMPRHSTLYQGN